MGHIIYPQKYLPTQIFWIFLNFFVGKKPTKITYFHGPRHHAHKNKLFSWATSSAHKNIWPLRIFEIFAWEKKPTHGNKGTTQTLSSGLLSHLSFSPTQQAGVWGERPGATAAVWLDAMAEGRPSAAVEWPAAASAIFEKSLRGPIWNGQSGDCIIGALIKDCLIFLNASSHSSSNMKGTSFCWSWVSGFAIFEKSFINLL